jgi:hypothetical protein
MRWTLRRQAGSSRRTKTPQRTAKSCGPGAATVASSRRAYPAGDGGKKRRSPGRARISRKTIARGKPGCLGCTCSLTRVLFCATRRTRDCGCIQRPAFPAPSRRREGQHRCTTRAKTCRGNESVCFFVIASDQAFSGVTLILRSRESGVSKDAGPSGASWFETRFALLTMRIG